MDTYRGRFIDGPDDGEPFAAFAASEDEAPTEPPPSPVGQDERRMQVRAYNHWASLLDNRNFPSIEDLDPHALPDFGPYSVLLDFTGGIENPSIQYLGDKLALECGADDSIAVLSDVPSRSLLSRITDHYMQILANQAPIGFEAEFLNQREKTILYRGILLPFSSDDDSIDFIYGVINWKELADQATTDELLSEIDSALGTAVGQIHDDPLTDWADGPSDALELEVEAGDDEAEDGIADTAGEPEAEDTQDDVLDLAGHAAIEDEDVLELDESFAAGDDGEVLDLADLPEPGFAADEPGERIPLDLGTLDFAAQSNEGAAFAELAEVDGDSGAMGLGDWLAEARELAEAARGAEDRSHRALYAAIGRSWDFALAALAEPEEFAELAAESGLTMQDRAPLTPVVKLVFGAGYDKTRLAEFAAALNLAQRLGIERGALAAYLAQAPGGLKGVVAEERRFKRGDSGATAAPPRDTPRQALARKLRKLEGVPLADVPAEGSEFTLLVARRLPSGEVVILGEVADDIPLLEKVAKKLVV